MSFEDFFRNYALKICAILLLLLGLDAWLHILPGKVFWAFLSIVKVIVSITCVIYGIGKLAEGIRSWGTPLLVIAFVFNPFVSVLHLSRGAWGLIDIIAAITLFVAHQTFSDNRKVKKSE